MNRHHCIKCHREIPAGEAVLRSVSLELVATHRVCPPRVPVQRGALSARLAGVR